MSVSVFSKLFLLAFVCSISACSTFSPFKKGQPSIGQSYFNSADLCSVAQASQHYLQQNEQDDYAVHDGFGVPVNRVKETLEFICQVEKEDQSRQIESRLHSPDFLQQHFDFYLWSPDKQRANMLADKSSHPVKAKKLRAIPEDKLLLTKYYTKILKGSAEKNAHHDQALYRLPYDEQGLSEAEIQLRKSSLTRFRLTRSEIISGALAEGNLAEPLIWLSEDALHDVLLQGTGLIHDGEKLRYFNVHKNNGIAYDYTIGMREQERYWYFAEVSGVLGYGHNLDSKVSLKPKVSLAGDIQQLGLGRLFLIQYLVGDKKQKHLAVLADQGGAFENNLFQLDLLVDSYYGWKDYYAANKHIPDYAEVWLMLKKEKLPAR